MLSVSDIPTDFLLPSLWVFFFFFFTPVHDIFASLRACRSESDRPNKGFSDRSMSEA